MLDLPWMLWLAAIVASFAVLEAFAFKHPTRSNTLSRTIATMGETFPLSIAIFGIIIGILLAHFFWAWCASPLMPGAG
jgi:ABC-type proline/glycine betaine transport system permease subunit